MTKNDPFQQKKGGKNDQKNDFFGNGPKQAKTGQKQGVPLDLMKNRPFLIKMTKNRQKTTKKRKRDPGSTHEIGLSKIAIYFFKESKKEVKNIKKTLLPG